MAERKGKKELYTRFESGRSVIGVVVVLEAFDHCSSINGV